jgi:hypothetical protein
MGLQHRIVESRHAVAEIHGWAAQQATAPESARFICGSGAGKTASRDASTCSRRRWRWICRPLQKLQEEIREDPQAIRLEVEGPNSEFEMDN